MVLGPGGVAALAATVAACPAPTALPPPPANRPVYAMTISIAANRKLVHGTSRVSFTLDHPTDRIVFRLWPNMPVEREVGARLDVRNVRVGGAAVSSTRPDPTTLVLAHAVAAGKRTTVSMSWTLTLPRKPTERLASADDVRLSSFFPLLAWSSTNWALDPPERQLETWTSPVADFDVKLTTPKGMRAVASGVREGKGRWHASAVRDFAVDAGRFAFARRTVHVPGRVAVTVAAPPTYAAALQPFLEAATRAVTTFSRRYAPYPWSTYTVVLEDDRLMLGEEYPTLVYVSVDATAPVVTHETAHQWFYSLVGDDQGRDPWLDESLAEWATARLDQNVGEEAGVITPAAVLDRLGEPMTFWGPLVFRPLVYDGLYLQGVKALASFGDDEGVDCALQHYVHDNAYRTATPRDLLAALTPTFPNAETLLTGFGADFSH